MASVHFVELTHSCNLLDYVCSGDNTGCIAFAWQKGWVLLETYTGTAWLDKVGDCFLKDVDGATSREDARHAFVAYLKNNS